MDAAAAVLTELGGVVDVEQSDGVYTIRGFSCPLADAVREHPATCRAAQKLVSEMWQHPFVESVPPAVNGCGFDGPPTTRRK